MNALLRNLLMYFLTPSARRWVWLGVSALFAGAFLMISSEIHEAQNGEIEAIAILDNFILNSIVPLRNPKLNSMMVDITALGSGTVLTFLVIILSLFMYYIRKSFISLHLIIAGIGSSLITQLMKAFFGRARPEISFRLVEVQGYSYPSGHSLSSAAIYFTLAIIFCSLLKSGHQRIVIGSFFVILIIAIGFSRIYLGVHFFSDVSGGTLLGLSWAAFLAAISSILEKRSSEIAEQAENI